ncbi:MAG: DUF4288 domain-containing protein [Acidobacteriota bacterium]|nr:DUF4288 domain-containing protein [Acidobacteriota bacterium]
MSNEPWYAAKCIFLHAETSGGHKQMYEERIILLRARSFDEAIDRTEKEAEEYCNDLDGSKYVGYVDVFHLTEGKVGDGAEIFSSMRRSDLQPKEYLNQFYPDEPDNCETIAEAHHWYNLDGERSACYHCKVVREGQLWRAKRRRAS